MAEAKNNSGVVLCTVLMALMALSMVVALTLRGDELYVNGVKQAAASGVSATQVTNAIDYRLTGNVFGSTGITNVWAGSQAQYDAISVKDAKTVYFIEE